MAAMNNRDRGPNNCPSSTVVMIRARGKPPGLNTISGLPDHMSCPHCGQDV
jgi:hypothetical protein